MAKHQVEISDQNFMAYLERLTAAVGHADRHEPLRVYLEGLLLPGERKSVEPMAARIDPRQVESRHQSMHHFVATSPWDPEALIRVARNVCGSTNSSTTAAWRRGCWTTHRIRRRAPIR